MTDALGSIGHRERWSTSRLEARLWFCGDDVCDCWQPVIEYISPNLAAGYPWLLIERRWEGTFCCEPTSKERAGMIRELTEAAARFGIDYISPNRA